MKTWRSVPSGSAARRAFRWAVLFGLTWAAPASELPQLTTNPLDREACSNQLRQIANALQAYRADHDGQLPAWLSDLSKGPYLSRSEVLTCPFIRSSLRYSELPKDVRPEVFRDPASDTSYSYEFSKVEYPDWADVYGFHVTVRDWKERQRRLVGDDLPIVRCFAHRPVVLNLSIGGNIFESGTDWEDRFTNLVDGSHATLNRLSTFAAEIRERLRQGPFPARAPGTPLQLLDLSPHFVAPLTVTWQPDAPSNHLAELPRGHHRLDDVEWDLRGVIQLNPSRAPYYFFESVRGIVVRQKCRGLHFLHATTGPVPLGTRVGSYGVHFSDGTEREIPLLWGQNIGEWWCKPGRPPTEETCRIAWEGSNPAVARREKRLRLYHARWENPAPDLEIATLDFVSALSQSAPFVIAITLE